MTQPSHKGKSMGISLRFPKELRIGPKTRFRLLAPQAFIFLTFSCSHVGARVLSHRFIGIPENTLLLGAPGFESCRLLSHSTPTISVSPPFPIKPPVES